MSKKSIEEILIVAGRGEPMDVEERSRLNAALGASAPLRAACDMQRRLSADLARLGEALRALPEPPADREDALRAAFRAQRARHRSHRPPRKHGASIAAVVGLIGAGAALLRFPASLFEHAARGVRNVPITTTPAAQTELGSRAQSAAPAAESLAGAFQPLLYSPGFSPSASYSIVRVRIPVSALAMSFGTDLDGTVEADILIGEDGLPTAIRFDRTDALASAVNQ